MNVCFWLIRARFLPQTITLLKLTVSFIPFSFTYLLHRYLGIALLLHHQASFPLFTLPITEIQIMTHVPLQSLNVPLVLKLPLPFCSFLYMCFNLCFVSLLFSFSSWKSKCRGGADLQGGSLSAVILLFFFFSISAGEKYSKVLHLWLETVSRIPREHSCSH